MTIDKEEIKALALACAPSKCADEAEEDRRLAEFHSELTPEAILALLAEIEQLAFEPAKHSRRLIDQLKAENEALRKALGNLLSLYEEDEGCRSLPQYTAGVTAMAKEASHG